MPIVDVSSETKNGVAIFRLNGRLTGGEVAEDVFRTVMAAVGEKPCRVIVDLSGVSWADSSGLGVSEKVCQRSG